MVSHRDSSSAPRFDSDAETLRAALSRAEGAAAAAYRDTARLIRLLTVIGTPSTPGRLIDRTLTVGRRGADHGQHPVDPRPADRPHADRALRG
ncbi:MAG TPA: hypothetical protein VK659_23050, partial [Asanoa sp.]|nr:hypothetical protein [Asanoa sp.]